MSAPWGQMITDALHTGGVTHVIICPGSRSAAIAAAVASSNLDSHVIYDERSAAFFALGISRVSQLPTALICTSGTAGAHFYPALIEASMSGIPLVAITADRPIEDHHAGSSQTIDQAHMFGRYVRSYVDIGSPCADPREQRAAWNKLCRAIATSRGPLPGPVHINAPFRKPLLAPTPLIEPMVNIHPPTPIPMCSPSAIDDIVTSLSRARRPLLICGPIAPEPGSASEPEPGSRDSNQQAILMLAQIARMPILAEATSQLRFIANDDRSDNLQIIEHFDETFHRSLNDDLIPDLIIECGTPPTSSGYARFLENRGSTIKRIAIRPLRYQDPSHNAAQVVVGRISSIVTRLCESLTNHLGNKEPMANATVASRTAFGKRWRIVNTAIRHTLSANLVAESNQPKLSGQSAIQTIIANLPTEAQLVIGNSLAIRWLNATPNKPHASSNKTPAPLALSVYSQRGVAGIDGLIASAVGVAIAGQRPTCLIVGDVSAAHDLGSLALASAVTTPLLICVLDNRGGQIFSELPYASDLPPKTLEKFFTTRPNIKFCAAAAAFGVTATVADTAKSLTTAVTTAVTNNAPTFIRIPIKIRSRPVLSTSPLGSSA